MLSYSEFKAALPAKKKASDATWTRFVMRPISLPLAWVLYRAGLSGNGASLAGLVAAVLGCALLIHPNLVVALCGVALLNLSALLDCVDGNIARAKRETGPDGEWIDAILAYTVYAFMPIALAIHAALLVPKFAILLMALGAVASSTNIFVRLTYQKFITTHPESRNDDPDIGGIGKRIDNEIGLGGLMMPGLIIVVALQVEIFYLAFYAAMFSCVTAMVVFKRVIAIKY